MRAWKIIVLAGCLAGSLPAVAGKDFRGAQLLGFTNFTDFARPPGVDEPTWVSPKVEAGIRWDELVISWNFRGETNAHLGIEAKVLYPDHETGWYCLGKWGREERESVRGQRDADGRVETDTLKLKEPAEAVQVRITLRGTTNLAALSFLGLSFCDSTAEWEARAPNRKAWGKALQVPERSQVDYPEGISEWCSPASTSMLLSFWAARLHRPELDYDVPEVAGAVHDPKWPGTGNWPFNTAFAGAHAGMRAYVARLRDVSELEDWIEAGVPVAVSVAYGFLKGEPERANGHLVVCIGFNERGDVIVNDPGRKQVRQVYARANFVKAWAESENTVYLVHPENFKVPEDRWGHWFDAAQFPP